MDPLAMAAGGVVGGIANFIGQGQTNQANEQMAQSQMDFQKAMSSTAYQRAVPDMQAAGLNPMLMMGTGAGASSPSGAAMQMQNPASSAVSSMQGGFDQAMNAEQKRAQNANINASTAKTIVDTGIAADDKSVKDAGLSTAQQAAKLGGGMFGNTVSGIVSGAKQYGSGKMQDFENWLTDKMTNKPDPSSSRGGPATGTSGTWSQPDPLTP